MIKRFFAELRINKKIARMFWILFTMLMMLLFLTITWNVAANFDKGLNGFNLIRKGVPFLFINGASKASKAYIISGAILGFFPLMALLPVLYFLSTSYLINFKIKPHFPNVINFSRWSKMIHLSLIILFFFIVGTIIVITNGGTLSHKESYKILMWAFDYKDLSRHTAGIGMWFIYIGAILPTVILFFWFLVIGLEIVFSMLNIYFKNKKEDKISKKDVKKNKENNDMI